MKSKKKQVAILGCGPAGLLAAHAAKKHGANVTVYSRKEPSRIHGAQFLHEFIPGLSPRKTMVRFVKLGEKQSYAEKVYGYKTAHCSWSSYREGELPAWSMWDAYQQLWNSWERQIIETEVNSDVLDTLENDGYDVLISSVPGHAICEDDKHFFNGQPIWVINASNRHLPGDKDTIIYSGRHKDPWYRFSRLFDHCYFEYGDSERIRTALANNLHKRGVKPLRHNCTCRKRWIRMGRFGKWEKGVLVHQSYQDTHRIMKSM